MRYFYLILSTLTILLQGLSQRANAQWVEQQKLSQQMRLYKLSHPNPTLFVHFDKTIYTNFEFVWFTAYLLKADLKEMQNHKVINVALVRDLDSVVVKQDKYVMDRGICFGTMVLPDTMITGNHHFLVSTDKVVKGNPEVMFIQPIIIKTTGEAPFNAKISLLKEGVSGKSPNQILLSVLSKDHRFLSKPVDVSYKYGNTYKKAKTNASGELVINVPEQEHLADQNLYAKVKFGKDSSYLNLTLPVTKRKATVNFYPEGGNLLEGIPCKVAWEVKDQQRATITSKAELYKNDQLWETLESNSYGIGKFVLVPESGATYKLKLLHSAYSDSLYTLPSAKKEGTGLMISDAAAGDTLLLKIFTTQPQKLALRLHDFKNTYIYYELNLANQFKIVKIPLEDVPKGLATLTVSDSLGRPLTERMLFTHYDPTKKIDITTDQGIYDQRQKVTFKLKLNEGDTVGFVSIACVQENRMSAKLANDIDMYAYLRHELGEIPLTSTGRGIENKEYVEDMLLVKGWTKYTWQDVLKAVPADTIKNYDSLPLRLRVNILDDPIKKPVTVAYLRGSLLSSITTDAKGIATLKNEDLMLEYGIDMRLFVTEKRQDLYNIKLMDPYRDLNKQYALQFAPTYSSVPSAIQNNTELSIKNNEKVIRLKEVNISSGGDNTLYGRNVCGDYVCVNNILNCINHRFHPHNKPPVEGNSYLDASRGGMNVVYKNCKEREGFIVPINGIYLAKKFYVDTYSDPLEPAMVSTLYWNHAAILKKETQEFQFYTGDIAGKFKIIVQGISNNDVLYGQNGFEVRAKE